MEYNKAGAERWSFIIDTRRGTEQRSEHVSPGEMFKESLWSMCVFFFKLRILTSLKEEAEIINSVLLTSRRGGSGRGECLYRRRFIFCSNQVNRLQSFTVSHHLNEGAWEPQSGAVCLHGLAICWHVQYDFMRLRKCKCVRAVIRQTFLSPHFFHPYLFFSFQLTSGDVRVWWFFLVNRRKDDDWIWIKIYQAYFHPPFRFLHFSQISNVQRFPALIFQKWAARRSTISVGAEWEKTKCSDVLKRVSLTGNSQIRAYMCMSLVLSVTVLWLSFRTAWACCTLFFFNSPIFSCYAAHIRLIYLQDNSPQHGQGHCESNNDLTCWHGTS